MGVPPPPFGHAISVTRDKPKNVCVGGYAQSGFILLFSWPYYASDLKSWRPTNAVRLCAMSIQNPSVQCGPYLTPVLSGPTLSYVTITRGMAKCFRSVFC